MKGQIPIIEMITVVAIIFVTFGIFFPQGNFDNRWDDADVILKGRDIVLAIDRSGQMNDFVANSTNLLGFLSTTVPEGSLIIWSTIDGTASERILVACNCTTSQISTLLSAVGRMRINERDVEIDFVASSLSPIQQSDALLIYGNEDLGPYEAEIINYLRSGSGVIGLSDVTNPDQTYDRIFGVETCADVLGPGNCGGNGGAEYDFITPASVSDPTFEPHKFFYHVPIRSLTQGIEQGSFLPIDPDALPAPPSCPTFQPPRGAFSFRDVDTTFWVCPDNGMAYFDYDGGGADVAVEEEESFSMSGDNFRMSYIDPINTTHGIIFVSIKPSFEFTEFKPSNVQLYPSDLDTNRILLQDGEYNPPAGNPIPVVVVNRSTAGPAIWAPLSITSDPFRHDKRLLLASLILAAADKESEDPFIGDFQIGFLTPYINVNNRDVFEVYRFNLGLGFPF